MPRMEVDQHSGAIIFHPTEDELEVKALKDDLQSMKDEFTTKLKQLDDLIAAQAKKGGSK